MSDECERRWAQLIWPSSAGRAGTSPLASVPILSPGNWTTQYTPLTYARSVVTTTKPIIKTFLPPSPNSDRNSKCLPDLSYLGCLEFNKRLHLPVYLYSKLYTLLWATKFPIFSIYCTTQTEINMLYNKIICICVHSVFSKSCSVFPLSNFTSLWPYPWIYKYEYIYIYTHKKMMWGNYPGKRGAKMENV